MEDNIMTRLNVGEKFPNFTFDTGFKTGLTVEKEFIGKKTVVWVLRYIGCTVCRYDCKLIADRYAEFEAKNAQVFVLMQSDPQHIQDDLQRTNATLPFEIICDPEMKIYKELDIKPAASMEELAGGQMEKLMAKGKAAKEAGFSHGDYEGDEQQLPAMFILDENGVATYVHYAANIVDMPTVDEVLNLL